MKRVRLSPMSRRRHYKIENRKFAIFCWVLGLCLGGESARYKTFVNVPDMICRISPFQFT